MRDNRVLEEFDVWFFSEFGQADDLVLTWTRMGSATSCEVVSFGPPDPVLARIQAQGQQHGIDIAVRQAKYRLTALDRAADAIMNSEPALHAVGFRLNSVAIADVARDRLTIYGSDAPPTLSAGDDGPLSDDLVKAVRNLVLGLDGIRDQIEAQDIHVEPGGHIVPA